ncbi:hypothetical protein BJP36_32780 [Moorena producens JHB]|uniref:Uncharacterized protein n=1 Tax=Moorena producens (strain JHB) TaxID=1454205 RepID=A0A1D9G8Z1_MOOP1|nr:hypothetical protein [Moorena producens]AOY83994.1 hypothetical protein BJP36_32780 [Moorena producens JHB]
MITQTRINQEFSTTEGLDWITALRGTQIRKLAEQEVVQLGLFDQTKKRGIGIIFLSWRKVNRLS